MEAPTQHLLSAIDLAIYFADRDKPEREGFKRAQYAAFIVAVESGAPAPVSYMIEAAGLDGWDDHHGPLVLLRQSRKLTADSEAENG